MERRNKKNNSIIWASLLILIVAPQLGFAKSYTVKNGLSCLNVRDRASTRARKITCADSGTRVQVLDWNPRGYSLVKIGKKRGYVWSKYLAKAPTSTPVAKPTPIVTPKPESTATPEATATPAPAPAAPAAATPAPAQPVPEIAPTAAPAPGAEEEAEAAPAPAAAEPAPATAPANTGSHSLWNSALSVASEGIIKPRGGYNLNSPNWPKIRKEGSRFVVDFPGSSSMCTSATAAAFLKHLADLANSGQITLTDKNIEFLNGKVVKNGLNGNSMSMALLLQGLGAKSVHAMRGSGGDRSKIRQALAMAKPGDVLKTFRYIGRGNRRGGHSTIFKGVRGDQYCYWSSNTSTKGVGEKCESIDKLIDVVITRMPSDLSGISENLDRMSGDRQLASRLHSGNANIAPNWIAWSRTLDGNDATAVARSSETPESVR